MGMYMNAIGPAATLELLAEEAAEASHAALKVARVLRGENPTPVSLEEAKEHLKEEIADASLMIEEVVGAWYLRSDIETEISRKRYRSADRFREAGLL